MVVQYIGFVENHKQFIGGKKMALILNILWFIFGGSFLAWLLWVFLG